MEPTNSQLAPDYGPPPDYTAWKAYESPPPVPAQLARRNRLKTAIGGLALAGLLVVGGAATVFAADPTPPPSTSPSVTTPDASPGTNGTRQPGTKADCPHNQTSTDTTTSTNSSS